MGFTPHDPRPTVRSGKRSKMGASANIRNADEGDRERETTRWAFPASTAGIERGVSGADLRNEDGPPVGEPTGRRI